MRLSAGQRTTRREPAVSYLGSSPTRLCSPTSLACTYLINPQVGHLYLGDSKLQTSHVLDILPTRSGKISDWIVPTARRSTLELRGHHGTANHSRFSCTGEGNSCKAAIGQIKQFCSRYLEDRRENNVATGLGEKGNQVPSHVSCQSLLAAVPSFPQNFYFVYFHNTFHVSSHDTNNWTGSDGSNPS